MDKDKDKDREDREKEAKEAIKNKKVNDQNVLLKLYTAQIDGTNRWVALGKTQNKLSIMYLLKTMKEPNESAEFNGLPIGYVYDGRPFVFSDATKERLDTFLTEKEKKPAAEAAKEKPTAEEANAKAAKAAKVEVAKPAAKAAKPEAKPAAASEEIYINLLDDLAKRPQSFETVNEFVEIYNIHNTSAEYLEASIKERKNPDLYGEDAKLQLLHGKVALFQSIAGFQKPDLFKLQAISGNDNNCFFHAFLFSCSDLFRNLPLACKNLIASYFRRTYTRKCYDNYLVKHPIKFTQADTNENHDKMLRQWSSKNSIEDPAIQKIVNIFKVNLLILSKLLLTNDDGLWIGTSSITESNKTIMMFNPGNYHFEVIYKDEPKKQYVFLNVQEPCLKIIASFLPPRGGRRKKSKVTTSKVATKKKPTKKGLKVTKRKKPFRRIKLGKA